MSNFIDSIKKYGYLRSVCYLILGIAILFSPRSVFRGIIYIIFFYLLIFGILQIIRGLRTKKYTGNIGFETTSGIMRVLVAFVVLWFSHNNLHSAAKSAAQIVMKVFHFSTLLIK